MQKCTCHYTQTVQKIIHPALHILELAFERGGCVLGGSRPSFRFLMRHLKDVPTSFLRCCQFPKFILHTEHCSTWQWSGTTSHSSQTRLKTFTEAHFPAVSFCSMEIFLMWVTTKLEDGQLLLAGWPFLVFWPRAHRLSCRLVFLFWLQILKCCKVWINFSNLTLLLLFGKYSLLVIGLNCIYNTGSASFL